MAFWNKKDGGRSRGHLPPERNPSFPALEAPKAWELTHAETAFQATSRSSFRTRAFKNLSKPDAPHEYLEADYLPVEKQWRVRSCIVGEGTALSALFKEPAESGEVATATQKSRTILQAAPVVEALQKLSLYEFGTDTTSRFALREAINEDLGASHFIEFAHAEGIIFDANGHPSLTQNGKPMRDGEFPEHEMKAAQDYFARYQESRRSPVIIQSSELSSIFQPHGKLGGFEGFSRLIQMESQVKKALTGADETINKCYDRAGESYHQKTWRNSYLSFNFFSDDTINALQGAIGSADQYGDVQKALKDSLLTFKIYRAAFSVSYYQNKKDDRNESNARCIQEYLSDVESLMTEHGFDDDMKANIRSFIMKNREISDFDTDVRNWKASVQSIHESIATQAQNIIQASQKKLVPLDGTTLPEPRQVLFDPGPY